MDYTVYKIGNTVNTRLYVGYTTKHLEVRLNDHILSAHNPNKTAGGVGCPLLYAAIRTYGGDKFFISAVERGDGKRTVMFAREGYWIRNLGTLDPHGYNQRGRLLSDEQIAIIRYNACNLPVCAYAQIFGVSEATAGIAKFGRGSCYTSDPYDYITRKHLPANIEEYMRQFEK